MANSIGFYSDSMGFYSDSMGLIVIQWDINGIYHQLMTNIAMENHLFLIGKSTINGPSIPWLC